MTVIIVGCKDSENAVYYADDDSVDDDLLDSDDDTADDDSSDDDTAGCEENVDAAIQICLDNEGTYTPKQLFTCVLNAMEDYADCLESLNINAVCLNTCNSSAETCLAPCGEYDEECIDSCACDYKYCVEWTCGITGILPGD